MNRRSFLLSSAALAGSLRVGAAISPPNVVIILADDLGYGDLGCYNKESKIPTPNLDALASRGMRFTTAHTPSAVCTPTRYGLLTGRYAWRTRLTQGVLDGFDPPLIEPDRLTIASFLKRAGYTTACIGKWHLGMQWTRKDGSGVPFRESFNGGFRDGRDVDFKKPVSGGPRSVGFDYYFGISASLDMSPYCFMENEGVTQVPKNDTPRDMSLFMNQVAGVTPEGFDLHGVLPECVRKAAEFIGKQKGSGRPFFLYMPLSAPHLPIVPNKEFQGRSKAGTYGDFVVEMDAVAGSVLTTLKSNGFEDNTLVFFSSDNGGLWHWWKFQEPDDVAEGQITPRGKYEKDYGHQSNGSLRGTKADLWEGGHRVPLIASLPGRIARGRVSERLICLTDVFPTIAEVCGIPLPSHPEDGFSFADALLGRGASAPVRDHVISHSVLGEFSIQRGEWKLILKRGSGGFSKPKTMPLHEGEAAGQLYNLAQDPQETRNLYLRQPKIVTELKDLLIKFQKEGRSTPNGWPISPKT